MKQLECPSKDAGSSRSARYATTFSVRISAWKCATDPAFEAGTLVASPNAKMFGLTFACRVAGSVSTNPMSSPSPGRSEEHTSELQSHSDLVCRLLLEKKKKI